VSKGGSILASGEAGGSDEDLICWYTVGNKDGVEGITIDKRPSSDYVEFGL
jgi:hypothetical protein